MILIILPFTEASYDFQTDLREDSFTVTTGGAESSATVQLFDYIYDDDVSTLEFVSNDEDDEPVYSSYNSTTRALVVAGLDTSTTRTLDVTYDIEAFDSNSINTLIDVFSFIWAILWVAFPIGALVAMWSGRVREMLGRA